LKIRLHPSDPCRCVAELRDMYTLLDFSGSLHLISDHTAIGERILCICHFFTDLGGLLVSSKMPVFGIMFKGLNTGNLGMFIIHGEASLREPA
jgi:hypothetical protein